jgi:hypothetical protein
MDRLQSTHPADKISSLSRRLDDYELDFSI